MSSGGVLLVDKPAGVTSHDVVALVRRATHTRRVGHTGTLDPFATGLLVVLIGRGTRLIPYVDAEPKVYEATIRFGAETDTDDVTGTTTRTANLPSDAAVNAGIAQLTGSIEQIPPDYSAKQVDGTRAYAAARRGNTLTLAPARVTVNDWTVLGRNGADLAVRITCGSGTYIRALARDLGRLSDSAAHLATLRRVQAGPFSVRDAVTVEDLRDGSVTLQSLRVAVPSLPVRRLDASERGRVGHGNAIAAAVVDDQPEGARIALVDDEETLIAVAERCGEELRPKLVLLDG
ncbi:MAG TPA: tRNA pseudouridine(55) synthase TruB [Gemmatimonadaceae bacterium]|jgi:tRNA pseudouridine55 synthase